MLLKALCRRFERTVIAIDVLDECDDLEGFVNALRDIVNSAEISKHVNILVTSRDELQIDRSLGALATCRVPMEEYVGQDISNYVLAEVETRMRAGVLKIRNVDLKQEITSALIKGARGM